MSRPKKAVVDYFPHFCNHKSTIFILEQKYGNDGYAFWFKLLELLGSTEGHYYDCSNAAQWEFLQAKTRLGEDKCNEILNLLSNLNAIDQELWLQKIIWSDNFISGISEVYRNRRVEIPSKPSFYTQKPQQDDVSTGENPQSKVKESKVNNINTLAQSVARVGKNDRLKSFESFWMLYPKKKSKGKAEKAWIKLNPDKQLQDRIKNALERAKKSEDWLKNSGQYIPHPATWLNARGWEDEYQTQTQYPLKVVL